MHYLGLSCVRNSSALHILNLNDKKIKVSEKVKTEMKRLRENATLIPLANLQIDNSPQTKTILFQNVRSLHLHIDDIQSDYNIAKTDVNIFVESTLCLLTARPWAERGSCFTQDLLLTARPWAERGSCSARDFFFFRFFVGDQTQTSPRPNHDRD